MNIPMFFFGEYDEEEHECTEVYPEEWIGKAYSVTWFLFTAFLPVSFMIALYTRVVYSLWFKHGQHKTQQV